MKPYRAAVVGAAAVAAVAGAVAVVAAVVTPSAETYPDAFDGAVSHAVDGPILARYEAEGGPTGRLGLPVTDDRAATFGPAVARGADHEVGFRHGVIYLDSRTGRTAVGVWFAWTPGPGR